MPRISKTKDDPPKGLMGKSNTQKKSLLDNDSDSDNESGGAEIGNSEWRINEGYARRFEHNKKREELHRCELLQPMQKFWHC
jgi:hypothetical protein